MQFVKYCKSSFQLFTYLQKKTSLLHGMMQFLENFLDLINAFTKWKTKFIL